MVEAPGKLVLLGEYAVLLPGGRALVMAVGPGIQAQAQCRDDGAFWVQADALGPEKHPGTWVDGRWRFEHPDLAFIEGAIAQCTARWGRLSLDLRVGRAQWRAHLELPAHLKPGLGGSASVSVATIGAILEAIQAEIAPRAAFEMAYLAHHHTQGGRGSGIDIAASTLGGVICLDGQGPGKPPMLQRLDWPSEWPKMAVFSGQSVKTVGRLAKFQALGRENPAFMQRFLHQSNACVDQAMAAMAGGDYDAFLAALDANRRALLDLGTAMAVEMEGPGIATLHQAAKHLAHIKQSGAGGGDSAWCFPKDKGVEAQLRRQIGEAGLYVLDLDYGAPGAILGDLAAF